MGNINNISQHILSRQTKYEKDKKETIEDAEKSQKIHYKKMLSIRRELIRRLNLIDETVLNGDPKDLNALCDMINGAYYELEREIIGLVECYYIYRNMTRNSRAKIMSDFKEYVDQFRDATKEIK